MTTEFRNHPSGGDGPQDAGLDAFFAAARPAPRPSADLLQRILADAAACAPAGALVAGAPAPAARRPGLIAGLVAALGGWPAMTGMAAATMAGVWVGFTTPSLLEASGVYASDYTLADLMPAAAYSLSDLEPLE